MEGFEGHYENLEGGYTVGFESYSADADIGELFRGLPDDRSQCPHWGYVLDGKVTFRYAGREETYAAGDAYYAPRATRPSSSRTRRSSSSARPTRSARRSAPSSRTSARQASRSDDVRRRPTPRC